MGGSTHLPVCKFVGERKRVEYDGESRVEKTLESKDGNSHGVNDIKIGSYDCTDFLAAGLE